MVFRMTVAICLAICFAAAQGSLPIQIMALSDSDSPPSRPAVAYNTIDGYYLAIWERYSEGESTMYVLRLDCSGKKIGDPRPFPLSSSSSVKGLDISYSSTDNLSLVVWSDDHEEAGTFRVYGSILSMTSKLFDSFAISEKLKPDAAPSSAIDHPDFPFPKVAWSDEDQLFIVVWSTLTSIKARFITQSYKDPADYPEMTICKGNSDFPYHVNPQVIYNPINKVFMITWMSVDNSVFTRVVRNRVPEPDMLVQVAKRSAPSTFTFPTAAYDIYRNEYMFAYQDSRQGYLKLFSEDANPNEDEYSIELLDFLLTDAPRRSTTSTSASRIDLIFTPRSQHYVYAHTEGSTGGDGTHSVIHISELASDDDGHPTLVKEMPSLQDEDLYRGSSPVLSTGCPKHDALLLFLSTHTDDDSSSSSSKSSKRTTNKWSLRASILELTAPQPSTSSSSAQKRSSESVVSESDVVLDDEEASADFDRLEDTLFASSSEEGEIEDNIEDISDEDYDDDNQIGQKQVEEQIQKEEENMRQIESREEQVDEDISAKEAEIESLKEKAQEAQDNLKTGHLHLNQALHELDLISKTEQVEKLLEDDIDAELEEEAEEEEEAYENDDPGYADDDELSNQGGDNDNHNDDIEWEEASLTEKISKLEEMKETQNQMKKELADLDTMLDEVREEEEREDPSDSEPYKPAIEIVEDQDQHLREVLEQTDVEIVQKEIEIADKQAEMRLETSPSSSSQQTAKNKTNRKKDSKKKSKNKSKGKGKKDRIKKKSEREKEFEQEIEVGEEEIEELEEELEELRSDNDVMPGFTEVAGDESEGSSSSVLVAAKGDSPQEISAQKDSCELNLSCRDYSSMKTFYFIVAIGAIVVTVVGGYLRCCRSTVGASGCCCCPKSRMLSIGDGGSKVYNDDGSIFMYEDDGL